MAKKNYSVLLKAYATVVVLGARDEDDAIDIAQDQISRGDFEIEEFSVERELKTTQELESAKKHAEFVSQPD